MSSSREKTVYIYTDLGYQLYGTPQYVSSLSHDGYKITYRGDEIYTKENVYFDGETVGTVQRLLSSYDRDSTLGEMPGEEDEGFVVYYWRVMNATEQESIRKVEVRMEGKANKAKDRKVRDKELAIGKAKKLLETEGLKVT
jgi:hypothetical protein